MARRNVTSEDRQLEHEINESLKVSNYLGKVAEAMEHNQKIDPGNMGVPNYKVPGGGVDPTSDLPQEHIDMDGLIGQLSPGTLENITASSTPVAQSQTHKSQPTNWTETPKFTISKNQMNAIKKFPSLIDFLGQEDGEKIANQVLGECNKAIATKLGENAKKIHKYAKVCEADRKNMRQYFEGEKWLCRVTASGPFHGDEVIYYNHEKDKSFVLRKSGKNYVDVSDEFNIIHDFVEKKESTNETSS